MSTDFPLNEDFNMVSYESNTETSLETLENCGLSLRVSLCKGKAFTIDGSSKIYINELSTRSKSEEIYAKIDKMLSDTGFARTSPLKTRSTRQSFEGL
jgi:hypothetical protein